MGFIALKCPSCGAEIQMDSSREFGFCQYCGTKIVQDKMVVEHKGRVGVDHSDEIKNLLMRANECMKMGDTDNAERYYNRVLDMDFDNQIARNGMQKLYQIVKEPNFRLSVTTGKFYNKKAKVDVTIDGVNRGEIANGSSNAYKLDPGIHNVRLKIVGVPFTKKDFIIEIKDRFTKIDHIVTCKIGNNIDVT